ncbi:type II toxin-antitoxin system Phd/YefM family antitoxin [Halothece sp. PCC 7418]|uniref:type II toxin-antitoxin system Phd/YefM family antitoxin n=1 Tax=Halothece sp. (strain PCC 7418) TaxID=65093 RepID=UPI001F17B390|nr:type II toxin-antitoxin system Phd/YefM family antitoxin [Halothece sp. PCC 7418]
MYKVVNVRRSMMKSYTLTQTRNQHGEVFDRAKIEPVLVTKQERPSHVILSAEAYQKLIARLEELEDLNWGNAAQTALNQSSMLGSDQFTTALEKIANG